MSKSNVADLKGLARRAVDPAREGPGEGHKVLRIEAEGDTCLLRYHRVPFARLEQRGRGLPAIGGALERPALEALRPKVPVVSF